jgi:transcriptional regulator with PAS, ATPase and Fis domain
MIGNSKPLRAVKDMIVKAAVTDSTIFIQGETGTGKEIVARAIHANSHRADQPFVAINCGALAEGTVESELFGHEKGAFTGAIALKRGKFELANGGTLFLDEIGELSLPLQVKLLRVLQEHEFERVGGSKPIKTDVRIITATHRDLKAAVGAGTFREDLYYRLIVVAISTPPLRERRDDIPVLAQHFVTQFARKIGRPVTGLTVAAHKMLESYGWPGNVRELQNVIERAIVVSTTSVLDTYHLPDLQPIVARAAESQATNSERRRLEAALKKTKADIDQVCVIMDMSIATVYRRVETYQLSHLLKRPRK